MMTLEFHQLELRYEALRRADQKKEKRLLGSLAEHGQQAPVMVIRGERDDQYALLDGYKRVRALKKLAVDTVQAVLWEMSETDALLLERLVRMDQEDSALEQGWFVRALIDDFGLSQNELSRRLDKSLSWVSRRLGLVNALPDEAIELVRAGKVCAHAAERFLVPLARAKKEDCLILAGAIAKEKLSTRQVALLHRGFVSGSDATRALLIENPALYLQAAAEAEKTAQEKKTKSPLDLVLDDLNIVASVSSRLNRRLHDPLLMLHTIKSEASVREAFALAKATFTKLERVLGEGEKDARSGNTNGNLEAA
jgi:ParB family transcriptional regulator, chromosome partitioning protein